MLLPTSVHGVEFILTFLFFCGVVSSSVVQEKCNELKPVVCPTYGMCCTADQFCSENSGTCESCFPEAFTKREERLKFCSDRERKRTNGSMRHYTCKAACVTLFNMTEIMNYVDKAPEKTAKELVTDHNSSMHEHLEDHVINRIDNNQRRVTSLEDQVSSLRLAAIILPVGLLIFIAVIIVVRCKLRKQKNLAHRKETKKLLDDDVEKKLIDAFNLEDNESLFSKTWLPFKNEFNSAINESIARDEEQKTRLQETEEKFTKSFEDFKTEMKNENANSLQQLEIKLKETEKVLDDDVRKTLIDAFNLKDNESLFSKTWLPFKDEFNTAINESIARDEEQKTRLQETEEKFTKSFEDFKTEMKNENATSLQQLEIKLKELQNSVVVEKEQNLDYTQNKRIDEIDEKLKYLMQKIGIQENLAHVEETLGDIEVTNTSKSNSDSKHERTPSGKLKVVLR